MAKDTAIVTIEGESRKPYPPMVPFSVTLGLDFKVMGN